MSGNIAILGTGPMAVMLGLELIRKAAPGKLDKIIFISRDNEEDIGRGQIGKTRNPYHLLNVLGARMSGDPEVADDFVKWTLREIAENTQDAREMLEAAAFYGIQGNDPANNFVSRKFHSQYMNESLWQKLGEEAREKGITITPVQGEIIQAEDKERKPGSQLNIKLKDGATITTDVMAIALGLPVKRMENEDQLVGVNGFVPSLYTPPEGSIFAKTHLRGEDTTNKTVVFIGSGLSTVDGMAQLATAGFEGNIKVISPSGKLPLRHKDPSQKFEKYTPDFKLEDIQESATQDGVLRAKGVYEFIVSKMEEAPSKNYAWQDVIDAFRPHIPALWKGLDNTQKKEFFDHYYSLWGDVRHRVPQQVYIKIKTHFEDTGRVEYIRGQVSNVYEAEAGLDVYYTPVGEPDPKKRSPRKITVDGEVAKCLGWEFRDLTGHPLLKGMHESEMIRRGILGLGIETHEKSRHNVVIVGQTRFQDELELTGFGELRPHAVKQSEALLSLLERQLEAKQEAARQNGYNLQHRREVLNGVRDVYDRYRRDLDRLVEGLVIRHPEKLEGLADSNPDFAELKKRLEQPGKPVAALVEQISDALFSKGRGLFDIYRDTLREKRPRLDEQAIEEFLEARRWTMATVRTILPELVKNNPDFLSKVEQTPFNPDSPGGYGKNLLDIDGRHSTFIHAFAFNPGQVTVPHSHISRCTSYLLEGDDLREIGFDTKEDVLLENAKPSQRKLPGTTTMATSIEEDMAFDWHIIINNGKDRALLLHIYDGAELLMENGKYDGRVRFETNLQDRPNSVKNFTDQPALGRKIMEKENTHYPLIVAKAKSLREISGLADNKPARGH